MSIELPMEKFEALAETLALNRVSAMHQRRRALTGEVEPIRVGTVEHEDRLYAAFDWAYHMLHAMRLVPLETYPGETFTRLADGAIPLPPDARISGLQGLRVDVDGVGMVCAEDVKIHRGLPALSRVSLKEAQAHDLRERERLSGWRGPLIRSAHAALQSLSIRWYTLAGNPVVEYRRTDSDARHLMLFWRHPSGEIREVHVSPDSPLEPVAEAE